MKAFGRQALSLLAILVYLAGGALVEITHHDETNLLLTSHPVLESHDCGANEIHLSVEDARQCFACSHFTQRLSTESFTFRIGDITRVGVAFVPSVDGQVLSTDILYSGKRGPPRA